MEKNEKGHIIFNKVVPNQARAIKNGTLKATDGCGPYYQGWWLKNIENKDWFMKVFRETKLPCRFYVELLLEHLAMIAQIPTIKSEIVKVNKTCYGLISEDYRKVGFEVFSGKDIMMEYLSYLERTNELINVLGIDNLDDLNESHYIYNSLEMISDALNYHFRYKRNKNEICTNILNGLSERYTFLFLMMQSDFHLGNWEILENDDIAFLTPCYDMDMSFRDSFFNSNNSMRCFKDPTLNIYDDFTIFYEQASEERKVRINSLLVLFTPETIANSIEVVSKNNGIDFPQNYKNNILKNYSLHYRNNVMNLLNEHNRTR